MPIYSTVCWACGSKNFIENVYKEHCPDCGIECLYHGSGANQKYNDAHDRLNKERAIEQEKNFREWWGDD